MKHEEDIEEHPDSINCRYCDALILDEDVSLSHPDYCSSDCAQDDAKDKEKRQRLELEHIRAESLINIFL